MFYTTGIDITNAKQMWNFLKNHPTYYTMNSWNGTKSIAHNVKLHKLNLSGDWCTAMSFLFDESDVGGLQSLISELCLDFDAEHPDYETGFNGRSGGYLVLYKKNSNRSALPECVDNYDTYEDFKSEVREYYNWTVKDYIPELRRAVQAVRDFDRLCDQLRDLVDSYSNMSYKDQVLAMNVESFNDNYFEDLKLVGLEPLEVKNGVVDFSGLCKLSCLKEAFLRYFHSYKHKIENNTLKLLVD